MASEWDSATPLELEAQDTNNNEPQPHPYLHDPLLYISGIPPHVTDEQLASAFTACAPFRPHITRDGSDQPVGGTIEFKYLDKAEKALATLQSRPIPGLIPPVHLVLSPYPFTNPPTPLPPASAQTRLVKHLPPGFTDSQLYDLFRPFGALHSVRAQSPYGQNTGIVEYWREEDAKVAEEAMHCAEVEGQNIAVQVWQPKRAGGQPLSDFNAAAAPFVPTASIYSYTTQYSPTRTQYSPPRTQYSPPGTQYSPTRASPYQPLPRSPVIVHGPGQQVQLAPGASHSGLIDPCNLFIKNLDTSIDSNGLFTHFRQFGSIVSARVMRNENGESRGFGFVSFQAPDQAAAAMHHMNGVQIGNKTLVVRLHEPKQLRQEKLAARFGHNGHPRSSSGATSPTASEAGESYGGFSSPKQRSQILSSPIMGHTGIDRPDRVRRSSGSYYHAALQGTLNLPMRYDDLSALSPVVRKEVLSGELNRRIKDIVPADELDAVVESIVSLTLGEVVQGIQNPDRLTQQIETARKTLHPSKTSTPAKSASPSPSPAASQADTQSSSLDANAPNATASAPDHPSTPLSMPATLSTPPRTESPAGSLPPTSEKDRMAAAVNKLEPSRGAELTELLMSLPKRERAMCLFNVEVLRAKIADAKAVLDIDEEGESQSAVVNPAPQTPVARKISTTYDASPKTPELSSRGPSATASPAPVTPSAPGTSAEVTGDSSATTTHTLASLARLPAVEIIRLANSSSATGLPLPKPDPLVVKSTDEWVDTILCRPVTQQKQVIGDKLWRTLKNSGFKLAPKITIALLDNEDMRSIAHLMHSYPQVLKEKASQMEPSLRK